MPSSLSCARGPALLGCLRRRLLRGPMWQPCHRPTRRNGHQSRRGAQNAAGLPEKRMRPETRKRVLVAAWPPKVTPAPRARQSARLLPYSYSVSKALMCPISWRGWQLTTQRPSQTWCLWRMVTPRRSLHPSPRTSPSQTAMVGSQCLQSQSHKRKRRRSLLRTTMRCCPNSGVFQLQRHPKHSLCPQAALPWRQRIRAETWWQSLPHAKCLVLC